MDRRLLDYTPVLETFGSDEFEREAERSTDAESAPLDVSEEFSLAAELLEVSRQADLDRFLFKLIGRAGAGKRLARSPVAGELAVLLRKAARMTLRPIHRSVCWLPGLAAPVWRPDPRLVSEAGEMFGLELEGLSPEDKEFALARQFVRFASEAVRTAGRRIGEPRAVASAGLRGAARRFAPGLLARLGPAQGAGPVPTAGRWVRRDGQIIVLGC
ncbi:hypothetical protein [Massilia consociata]|uniref:Uncharacterized protein n=1 Tax=Massilia consociata TaxID=760117 RepID=A0ABV6FK44_9BURK